MTDKIFPTNFNRLTVTGGNANSLLGDDGSNNGYMNVADLPAGMLLLTTIVNSSINVTLALHNNRVLICVPGAALFFDWASLGHGFSCGIINETGADLSVSMGNYTNTSPTNSYGATKVQNNGVGSIWSYSPDGGTTKNLRIHGQVIP